MGISATDRQILRDLAKRVAEIAALPQQSEKARLWKACNDLKPQRAMVFADPQNGWAELNAAWLRLLCNDASLHWMEHSLRARTIRHEHIPDDFPILAEFRVPLSVHGADYEDYGLHLGVQRTAQKGGAYRIEPAVHSEKDLEKLHFRPIRIDHKATDGQVAAARDIFGDILPVRKTGRTFWRYGLTRVLIHMRGLDQMMLDMYDNPSLLHRMMAFLRDDFLREIDLFEQAGGLALNNTPDTITGSGGLGPTGDLPAADFSGTVRPKDCFCSAESQETVGVGPAQFDEFVLQYQLPLMQRFGLVDYGCCEPLDHKLDLLRRKIPNLRWVAVSPWSNRQLAAERLGRRYVYVYKPNPARICAPRADWEAAEEDIRSTLRIARACPVHVVMKDTHTLCNEPDRVTRWAELAVRIAKEAV
jgi:hypothetical protein